MSHKKKKQKADDIPDKNYRGHRARSGNQMLRSWTVGGLPLGDFNETGRLLDRMRLHAPILRNGARKVSAAR